MYFFLSLTLLREFGREAVENENKNVHHSSHHAKEKRFTKGKMYTFLVFTKVLRLVV